MSNKNSKNKKHHKFLTGFTLIEVLIACFIIVVGVIGSYIVVQNIFAQTFEASTRLTAIYLAKEGAEIVRNIRDTGWLEGDNWNNNGIGAHNTYWEGEYLYSSSLIPCSAPCEFNDLTFLKDNNPFYGYGAGSNTRFRRRIKIERPTADSIKAIVNVFWQRKGTVHGVTIESYLYDWKQ